MSTIEKIKRTILIALGFGLATYLIMSGWAILKQEKQSEKIPLQEVKLNEQNNSQQE